MRPKVPIDTTQECLGPFPNWRRFRLLGPFWLSPTIRRHNAVTYFLAAMLGISMMASLSFMQPIAIKLAGVERAIQGTVTGDLAFYQEVLVLLMTPFVGALADKIGRRPIMVTGFFMLGVGYSLFPYATSVEMLYAFRSAFAVGVACIATTLVIINTDYVQEGSRGKWVATSSFIQGIGVLAMSQFVGRVPPMLATRGFDEPAIAKVLFWGAMLICVGALIAMRFGLSTYKPPETRERDPLLVLVKSGLLAARENARVALGYTTAFAARGDVLVVGTFLFLWTQQAAEDLGLGVADGFRRGGILMGIIQGTALLAAYAQSFFLDKIDRVTRRDPGFHDGRHRLSEPRLHRGSVLRPGAVRRVPAGSGRDRHHHHGQRIDRSECPLHPSWRGAGRIRVERRDGHPCRDMAGWQALRPVDARRALRADGCYQYIDRPVRAVRPFQDACASMSRLRKVSTTRDGLGERRITARKSQS